MPKNKGKGGKNRRKGKGDSTMKTELIYKQDGQAYAQIICPTGGGFMKVKCFEGVTTSEKRGHIRGGLRKRGWIGAGDIVLVSLRGFQDDTCDIMHKYNTDDARELRMHGKIPSETTINEKKTDDEASITFDADPNAVDSGSESESESDDGLEDVPTKKVQPKKANAKASETNDVNAKASSSREVPAQKRNLDLPPVIDDDFINGI